MLLYLSSYYISYMPTLLKITKDHYLKCEKPNNVFSNVITSVGLDLFRYTCKGYSMGTCSACVQGCKQKVKTQLIPSLALISIAKKAGPNHILHKKTFKICVCLH